MKYEGLSIYDKPALIDAKGDGANWIAREWNRTLWGFVDKPEKADDDWFSTWINTSNQNKLILDDDELHFISWNDNEPVHIDSALDQIADMEDEQRELIARTVTFVPPARCEYCSRTDIDDLVCYIPNDETGGFIKYFAKYFKNNND